MRLLRKIHKKENGQVLILVLILLLLGGLITAPLLAFMSTGLKAGEAYENKMDEVYAADSGVEDAMYKIMTDYLPFEALDEGGSNIYQLTDINGLPVDITVTKISLLQSILGEDEYNTDRPHEAWVTFVVPPEYIVRNYEEGWVEIYCEIEFEYTGAGNRQLVSVGAYFAPPPADETLISDDSPYDYINPNPEPPLPETPWGIMTFDDLEADSPETKIVPGGFAFIWRWSKSPPNGPIFNSGDIGGYSFKFKIYDPDWADPEPIYFIWATFKEQDISYVTNALGLYKWMIEADAGNTTVRTIVLEEFTGMSILSWEINPPH